MEEKINISISWIKILFYDLEPFTRSFGYVLSQLDSSHASSLVYWLTPMIQLYTYIYTCRWCIDPLSWWYKGKCHTLIRISWNTWSLSVSDRLCKLVYLCLGDAHVQLYELYSNCLYVKSCLWHRLSSIIMHLRPTVASAAVHSKVVTLLLFSHSIVCRESVFGAYFGIQYLISVISSFAIILMRKRELVAVL